MIHMIKTKRLKLLPFEKNYAEAYYHGFDADITKYQYPEPFESLEDAKAFLKGFIEDMEKGEMLFYVILDSEEEFVGSLEVHGLQDEMPELGIWITKQQQRKGYAYEALRAVVDYVSSQYGKKKFFYEADVRNVGSRQLLQKFQHEEKDVDKFTTESGKYLELLGAVLEA